jgi:7-carboxy-7-deazaguanine synthase
VVPDDDTLLVNEVYASIQGESSHAGRLCVFVRLTGCNLRCKWCDTEYAFYEGERRPIDAVVEQVLGYGIPLVEITGGEPLLQKGCPVLAQRLLDAGLTVLVETSGALPIDALPAGTIRIMDLKCPSSGECDKNEWRNIVNLTPRDEVKFVIADRADYEWAKDAMSRHDLARRCRVLISPVHGTVAAEDVVAWMLADRLDARFQLQMHKYIWGPERRGV